MNGGALTIVTKLAYADVAVDEISLSIFLLVVCGGILVAVIGDTALAWWETRNYEKGELKPDETDAP